MPNYTTTSLVKASLGIPSGTTSEDAYIEDAIDAAEDEINEYCDRTFVADGSATARVYQPSTNVLVYTDDFYTTTSLVVKQDDSNDGTYGTTLTITDDFIVVGNSAPFNCIRSVSSPFPRYTSNRPTVQVTAKWGYKTAVPAAVAQAALILSARLFQRRSSPLGIAAGIVNDFGPIRITRQDPDIQRLLAGYRRIGVA
tara:strand:- start:92 stop:685 length:594 start_codon:yes stop_codon:yes gene_type:complete